MTFQQRAECSDVRHSEQLKQLFAREKRTILSAADAMLPSYDPCNDAGLFARAGGPRRPDLPSKKNALDVQCGSIGHGVVCSSKPPIATKPGWRDCARTPPEAPFRGFGTFDVSAAHLPLPPPRRRTPHLPAEGVSHLRHTLGGTSSRRTSRASDAATSYAPSSRSTLGDATSAASSSSALTGTTAAASSRRPSLHASEPAAYSGAPPASGALPSWGSGSRTGAGRGCGDGYDGLSSQAPLTVSSPPSSITCSRASRLSRLAPRRSRARHAQRTPSTARGSGEGEGDDDDEGADGDGGRGNGSRGTSSRRSLSERASGSGGGSSRSRRSARRSGKSGSSSSRQRPRPEVSEIRFP